MDKQNNINLIEEAKSETTSSDRLKELAALNDKLAQIVASNISAPPELLADLMSHKNKAVRKAVVNNPNSRTETLFKFGEYFFQELLNSTTFISHFEKNNFIEDIPLRFLLKLVQYKNTPKFILNL